MIEFYKLHYVQYPLIYISFCIYFFFFFFHFFHHNFYHFFRNCRSCKWWSIMDYFLFSVFAFIFDYQFYHIFLLSNSLYYYYNSLFKNLPLIKIHLQAWKVSSHIVDRIQKRWKIVKSFFWSHTIMVPSFSNK